jgi:hypothetical protein
MQVFGDARKLKDSLRKEYGRKIGEARASARKEISLIGSEEKRRNEGLRQQMLSEIESMKMEAKAVTLNEEKLNAKRSFEESRERMVEELLSDIRKELPVKMKEKEFLSFLSKNAPKNYDAAVGHSHFKGKFRRFKVDNEVLGVRFRTENMLIDLSLNGLLEARSDRIREKIIREVWHD